jgi:hypothetical protein
MLPVVMGGLSNFLDVSVFGAVVVVCPVVFTLFDFTDSVEFEDVVVVIDEYSTLPEVSVVESDCIFWWVVCCVVGESHSIRITCVRSLLLSKML